MKDDINRAYKNVWELQNASNFSGVLRAFSEARDAIWEELRVLGDESSDAFASHPICIAWMDKLFDLQGRPDTDTVMNAFSVLHDRYEQIKKVGEAADVTKTEEEA